MQTYDALREGFLALSLAQRGPEVQECFNALAYTLINQWSIRLKAGERELEIRLRGFEFASSAFEDRIRRHEHQARPGLIYIHRHPKNQDRFHAPKMVGMDVTCGNPETHGTLLIQAVEINGEITTGPNRAFHAISRALEIGAQDFHLLDGRDLLDPTSPCRLVPASFAEPLPISLTVRRSMAQDGALLRALSDGKANPQAILVKAKDIVPVEGKIISSVKAAKNATRISIASSIRNRYKSLRHRTFRKEYEVYLYCRLLFDQAAKSLSEQDFVRFVQSDSDELRMKRLEAQANMDQDYVSLAFLKHKNRVFKPHLDCELEERCEEAYSELFAQVLTEDEFARFFTEQTACHYCGLTVEEMKRLADEKKVRTKRRYIKGKSLEVDRVDSNGPYSLKNIVMCCYWCNNAKTDEFDESEFKEIAQMIGQVWKARLS